MGRYKLLEKIGEGGFGDVWMAEQREPVKRRVALKIIKLGMDTRQVVARFEAERQALAMMDHSNIARVFDAGATETGRPYFVMELVSGSRITEYCDKNALPTAERLKLFILVCQAIQHAHQKGIIHRDIKPSNILVTLHDGVPMPKVIDFGIAKATQFELTDKTLFTQFQQFIGTPAYISPEQAEGSGLDIDTRSDIYSLGVLLYELLVGRTPFDAKEMTKGGINALRQVIREAEPLKPSTKVKTLPAAELTSTAHQRQTDALRLTHLLRGDLDWIIMKCLEKDRARRYDTANELARDIQRYLANEGVVARPPSTVYKIQKAWQRNKLAFVSGAAIVAALVAGIVLTTWQATRAIDAERLARLRLAEAVSERDAREKAKIELEARNLDLRWALYKSGIQSAGAALERGEYGQARDFLNTCEPGLRAWEWNHLSLQIPLLREYGSKPSIGAVLTQDRTRIVSAGTGGEVSSWDARDGTRQSEFALRGTPSIMALSPDERLVAIGGEDGMVALYNLQSGSLIWERAAHPGRISGLAFNPDGSRIATCGLEGAVILWDDAGRILRTNRGGGRVRSVGFSPDGRILLAGSVEDPARMLAADTLEVICKLDSVSGGQPFVAFSPDGRRFATGFSDGFVRVWDTTRRELLAVSALAHMKERENEYRSISGLTFSPDGRQIASSGQDELIRFWDASSGRMLGTLPGMIVAPKWLPRLQFSSDGRELLAAGGSRKSAATLWNLAVNPSFTLMENHSDKIWSAAFTPNSRQIVTAGWSDGQLTFLEAADGREIRRIHAHQSVIWSVAVTPDGRRAVSGSKDGALGVWDLDTGQNVRLIPVQSPATSTNKGDDLTLFVALNPNGREVVSGGQDGKVQGWNLDTGARVWELTNHAERVWSIAWNIDGRRIAVGRLGGKLTMIDAINHAELWHTNVATTSAYIASLAFRPDQEQVLAANLTGELDLINTETGSLVKRIGTELGWIRSVCFSPDGRRIASAGDHGIVRLWDSASGDLVMPLPREPVRINFIAFSPDGRRLFSVRNDGKARIWQTEFFPFPSN